MTPFTFHSDGLALEGTLRVPDGPAQETGWPTVVLTGPLSGVKEQVVGLYAEKLTAAGFATLAFDHRNFGASEGEPRQHENSAGKLADLRDAVSALAIHPAVDENRIGAVGICLGGGYALRFAAFDPRIKAVACIAGGYNDPAAMRAAMGADAYRAQLLQAAGTAAEQYSTGRIDYLAAVSDDEDVPAVMAGPEPFAYYGTERSKADTWVNRLTALTVRELITVDLAIGADFLGPTPLLVVHGTTDAYCSPEGAQTVFERAKGPAQILWLDTTNHIDLYDGPKYVEPAVERTVEFLMSSM
ncbi:alpha/beta hydrolase [Cryptosporangium phraense]|uniref:Alpha/beta hydrolase n=1 Tax=Cryptosporangium phraense TaxID=2593070 RepID=A0A545AZ29_9ACTN|nr:alpha/beta hydrolase [Cryptosporangium phraense]TQS46589.1 alpha/beta hydrolase [Cryptosporangium phraense]